MFVLAVHDLRHNGNCSSIFFFSSANIRSLEILRPNAIGLALDLRFSIFRLTGLNELTRCIYWRAMREWFAKFFSSFRELNEVVRLPADRERLDVGTRLLRNVMVPLSIAVFATSPLLPITFEKTFNVEFCFDEMRLGGSGALIGMNDCVCLGNGANKSIGLVTFVMG